MAGLPAAFLNGLQNYNDDVADANIAAFANQRSVFAFYRVFQPVRRTIPRSNPPVEIPDLTQAQKIIAIQAAFGDIWNLPLMHNRRLTVGSEVPNYLNLYSQVAAHDNLMFKEFNNHHAFRGKSPSRYDKTFKKSFTALMVWQLSVGNVVTDPPTARANSLSHRMQGPRNADPIKLIGDPFVEQVCCYYDKDYCLDMQYLNGGFRRINLEHFLKDKRNKAVTFGVYSCEGLRIHETNETLESTMINGIFYPHLLALAAMDPNFVTLVLASRQLYLTPAETSQLAGLADVGVRDFITFRPVAAHGGAAAGGAVGGAAP